MERNGRSRKQRTNRYDGRSRGGEVEPPRASLKNQIRSIKRLVAKGDLDAPTTAKQEAKLRHLEKLFRRNGEKKLKQQRERKLAKKYHKVRFFERVKVERKLKRVASRIKDCSSPGTKLLEELHTLQDDLAYIKYFPKGEKYISLFPQKELTAEQELIRSRMRDRAIKTWKDSQTTSHPCHKQTESVSKKSRIEYEKRTKANEEQDDFLL